MSNRRFGRTAERSAPATPRGTDDDGSDQVAGDTMVPTPLLTIDALGRKCPIPIIMLAERIHEVPIGEIIAVLADDPAAENDVPAWCLMKSHDHVFTQSLAHGGWSILIRRGY
jgi:tRNA 2-thiouridine synthesizing protein A